MSKKTTVETADGKKTIHELAKSCLEKYEERESDNINRAKEAIEFRSGEQWPDAIKQARENQHQKGGSRPCPVMDKTDQFVRQIVNEMRQNRAAIKYRPVDDFADKKVAEVYTGLARHIEDASEALVAYSTAAEHAIDGGFGYFRIVTEYCDPNSFDQDIRIKRIHNRFSVALGPHTEPDGADAREGLIWEDVDKEQFKSMYPKAKVESWETDGAWVTDDTIRVAEYFRIENKPTTIYLMPDGSTWSKDELEEAGLDAKAALKSRETTFKQVKWYKIAGEDEVLKETDLPGDYIPIVKATGSEITMPDGKIRLSGALERAMEPQRLHNYSIAGYIEHVALAPRAPWVGAKEAIKGYEDDYADANSQNVTYLPFNHLDAQGNPLPMPQRTPPAGIPTGMDKMIQQSEHAVEAAFGMYGPSVGAKSQEKSGIALQEQKEQGMIGNFHFADNLARAIQHCGRIMLQWIPVYYDTERTARVLGDDGKETMAYLNPEQEQAVMPRIDKFGRKLGDSYNLNVGKYDVTVSVGPSYTAKRQEAAQTLIELTDKWPELKAIAGDKLLKALDIPDSEALAERAKFLLPPEIRQSESENEQDGENNLQQKMLQLQQASQALEQKAKVLFSKEQELTQAQQAIQEAGTEATQERAAVESLKKDVEASRKVLSSEQARFAAEVRNAQLEIQLEAMKTREQGEGNAEESSIKAYEADKKYQAELAKAAASIIEAQITASGQPVEPQGQAPDRLEAVMAMLNEAVQKMSAPKRVVFDEGGNPVGIETVQAEVMQ